MRFVALLAVLVPATVHAAPAAPASDWSYVSLADVMTAIRPLAAGEHALRVPGAGWATVEGACDPPCNVTTIKPTTTAAVWADDGIHEYTAAELAALANAAALADPLRRAFDFMLHGHFGYRGVWVSSKTVSQEIPATLTAAPLHAIDTHLAELTVATAKQSEITASPEDTAAARILAKTTVRGYIGATSIAVTPLHTGFLVRASQPPPQGGCHVGEQAGQIVALVIGETITILEEEMPTGGGCRDPVGPRRR